MAISMNYKTPGVYTTKVKGSARINYSGNVNVAGFVGTCKRGSATNPFVVTSWSECVDKISGGLDSPFSPDSYLAFAAQSFFMNGGSILFISRVCTNAVKSASCEVTLSDDSTIIFEAKDEGAWGNELKIWVTENDLIEGTLDVHIQQGNNTPEVLTQLTNEEGTARYFKHYIDVYSKYVNVIYGNKIEVFTEKTFNGGDDGEEGLTDADYVRALNKFDLIDDVTLIAVPGQTSVSVRNGIIAFLNSHEFTFGAIDAPITYVTEDLKELRKSLDCDRAVLLSSWHNISDPLSSLSSALRPIPSSGAYLGNVANSIESVGAWREPAGLMYKITGAVSLIFSPQKADTDILNPINVICLVAKPNYGIVIWGARTLTVDSSYMYVSAVLLDIYIRKNIKEACQSVVFDPNKSGADGIQERVRMIALNFLQNLSSQGAFATSGSDSYFVKCDSELNPPSVVEQGYVICRCGYAHAKPGEFIVFEFQNNI